jgi:L-fuconolactonase
MIVDAHHHLWDPRPGQYAWMTTEFDPINRRFGPEDLAPCLAACGVDRTVVVQTYSSLDETRAFLSTAAGTPFIAGVVGWVDLTTGGAEETIGALQAGPGGRRLVGIRHQVHDEADPRWLLQPAVQQSIAGVGRAGLAFDLLVRPRELPAALDTVAAHREVRFVIDHVAKPPIRDGGSTEWDRWMPRLAACPNVSCKLSGMVTEADWRAWTVADLRPYARSVLEWFGPERILFGSDWPVCLLAAPYRAVFEAAHRLASELAPGREAAILGENAVRIYRLESL